MILHVNLGINCAASLSVTQEQRFDNDMGARSTEDDGREIGVADLPDNDLIVLPAKPSIADRKSGLKTPAEIPSTGQ
jgi:hypothetical protein